jgi:hypothetical protein
MSAMGEMPMPGGWTMSMAWMRMLGQTWPDAAATLLGMIVVATVDPDYRNRPCPRDNSVGRVFQGSLPEPAWIAGQLRKAIPSTGGTAPR